MNQLAHDPAPEQHRFVMRFAKPQPGLGADYREVRTGFFSDDTSGPEAEIIFAEVLAARLTARDDGYNEDTVWFEPPVAEL